MLKPPDTAYAIITKVMSAGSRKDGSNDSWRNETVEFHLTKAMSHLAMHMKQKYDPRTIDGENHLELALTRLAFAATYQP